jgi:ribosomal protein S18 acetylase RimI-like enzyme
MAATFSLATASDENHLIALMRAFYAVEHLRFDEDAVRRALRALFGDGRFGQVFLIRSEGEVAGYLVLAFGFSLEFHGRDAFVDELYVREPFRGRGLGRAALAHAEAVCRDAGIEALHLEVDRENGRAQALYERAGYRDRGNYLLTKGLTAT